MSKVDKNTTSEYCREEWDQFVVEGDSLLASAVPLSWVLPPAQPDFQWAAFLKR